MSAIKGFFKDWYRKRRSDFNYPITPIRPDDVTDFRFSGLSPHLVGHLTDHSVDLAVHYCDRFWDLILSIR